MPLAGQELPKQSEPQEVLSPNEIREGILRIEQLILVWREAELLKNAIGRQEELRQREQAVSARELDLEKQRTAIAEKETALEKERADFYQAAMKALTQKRGFGCWMKKVFTAGLGRCL